MFVFLFFLRNLNNNVFTFVRKFGGAVSDCIAYTNCDNRNILIIQILPHTLKLCFFHCAIICSILCNLWLQFSSRLEACIQLWNYMPKILSCLFNFKSKWVSAHCFSEPSHLASVLFLFIFRQKNSEKSLISERTFSRSALSHRNRCGLYLNRFW